MEMDEVDACVTKYRFQLFCPGMIPYSSYSQGNRFHRANLVVMLLNRQNFHAFGSKEVDLTSENLIFTTRVLVIIVDDRNFHLDDHHQ